LKKPMLVEDREDPLLDVFGRKLARVVAFADSGQELPVLLGHAGACAGTRAPDAPRPSGRHPPNSTQRMR